MNSPRRAPAWTQFAAGTAAISAAAWVATQIGRGIPHDRLEYPIFERLFAFGDNWAALLEVGIVLLVWAVPGIRRAGARLAIAMGDHPRRTAFATFCVAALGARFVYHASPFAMDEYAQLAQAYCFAHGHLSWYIPVDLLDRSIPRGFRNDFFAVNDATGQVASMYWPGFAALLTPFAWAGVPWLLNPAVTAATVLLVHALGLRILGSREAAGWAVLFTLASPAFTINGIALYSMPAHLVLNLAFMWLLLDGRASRALIAGLAGAVALILHNPVPHLLFALPWIVWLLTDRRRWPALRALVAGYLPLGLGVGIGWALYIATIGPHLASGAAAADTGGLWGLVIGKIHGVVRLPDYQMINARLQATWKLWIWSSPGLIILAFAGLRRAPGPLRLLAVSAAVTYVAYWFVPFDQGHGWGYRYVHPAWAALPLLGAAFISASRIGEPPADAWRAWAGGLAAASLVLATSLWFRQVEDVIGEHLAQRIPAPAAGRWIVFVAFRRGLYTWDMIQNFPGESRVLVLMSFGPSADSRLAEARFPGARRTLLDSRGSLWSLPDGPGSTGRR